MRKFFKYIRAQIFGRSSAFQETEKSANQHHHLLAEGNLQLNAGNIESAITHFSEACRLFPDSDDAHLRLGYALRSVQRIAESQNALLTCISLNRQNVDAHYLLGEISMLTGQFAEAAKSFGAALELNPLIDHAYQPAAAALVRSGNRKQAFTVLTQAVNLFPENSDFYYYLGDLLAESGDYSQAVIVLSYAIKIAPHHAAALASLGNSERHLGRTKEAAEHLTQAISLKPDQAHWYSDLLFTLQYSGTLTQKEIFEKHVEFSARFELPLQTASTSQSLFLRQPGRLKIGYVSGDFRCHSLSFFIEPILKYHDRSRVEVHCYYTYPTKDSTTERLMSFAEHWRDCADLSDSGLTDLIRHDGIEILIDLSGHTGFNRLGVFARRAAPVQMTWLGYQATTGLVSMDYRLTDAGADPVGKTERYHTEKLIRLSSGAVFQPQANSPDVNELPAIVAGFFMFACLNNPAKITDDFIKNAAAIINNTKNTKLLFGNVDESLRKSLTETFSKYGTSDERIIMLEKMPMTEYLELHHRIDMALDTFPYNGGTTTLHSLWMGVPVLSLEGNASISRVGSETMRGLGLPEFCCETSDAYVRRAIKLSENLEFMRATRRELRNRLSVTLVDKAKDFTLELENVFFDRRISNESIYTN